MNIAVYCASRPGSDAAYMQAAKALGAWIGANGHTLVYGGSDGGLMGALADAALENGAEVIGVVPDVERIRARAHRGLTRRIDTPGMAERRTKMLELADAIVALPGGLGTLDEVTEALSLASLDRISAPIAFFGAKGYYQPLKAVFENVLQSGFGSEEYFERVLFTEDIGELAAFVNRETDR